MAQEETSTFLNQLILSAKDSSNSKFDLAKLLLSFIDGFIRGVVPCDFEELMGTMALKASSPTYCEKVEDLNSMVASLYNILLEEEKARLQNEGEEKQWDLFDVSIEITPGKNLSALSRRNAAKKPNASKKAPKSVPSPRRVHSFVPVDLLPLEGEEKGDIFYDTKGEPVGHTNNFAINRSRVHGNGCLLFDTISPELVDIVNETTANNVGCKGYYARDNNDVGCPSSSGCPSSASNSSRGEKPKGKKTKSEEFVAVKAPIGKECTYTLPAQLRGENPPLEPIAGYCYRKFFDSKFRKSEDSRIKTGDKYSFLNSCFENNSTLCKRRDELYGGNKDYQRFIKKKKSRVSSVDSDENVDSSDESGDDSDESGDEAEYDGSEKADGTGDSSDGSDGSDELNGAATSDGEPANPGLEFDDINILRTLTHTFEGAENAIMADSDESGDDSDGSGDSSEEADETGDISYGSEGSDELNGTATLDGEPANPGLEFDDINILRKLTHTFEGAENAINDSDESGDKAEDGGSEKTDKTGDSSDGSEGSDELNGADDIKEREVSQETKPEFYFDHVFRGMQRYTLRKFIAKYQGENREVRVWQTALIPFLSDINTKDNFDINLYGSRILDAFGNSNRRQTMTFSQFCKDKGLEMGEAHRFFIALLPLANMGYVELSNDPREGLGEEDDDLVITLLSRKMHHVDLEEFGHDSGEHK